MRSMREGHAVKLSYVGRAPTLRQQSQPFLFRIDEAHAGLTIGAPVKVLVQTPRPPRVTCCRTQPSFAGSTGCRRFG